MNDGDNVNDDDDHVDIISLLAAKSRVFEHLLSLFKTQTLETAFAIFSHSSTVLPD